ncbi:MAG TPA: hypothetical protein VGB61_04710 [Pyrinomonadaceae bacterium]|jgi:hypothetical protein
MRKLYISVTAITLTAGLAAYWFLSSPSPLFATSSPAKTYRVELAGDKSSPYLPAIEHEVSFDVFKHGNRIIKNARAHSGDWFDISFELAYPQHIWADEAILRFGRELNAPGVKTDTLAVKNTTGKTIKYLKIKSKDMFLIFDLPPQSMRSLTSSHQSWLSWIEGEGEFTDGGRISWSGVNFSHHDRLGESLRYCISISESGLRIESPQIEGFDAQASGDAPNVPKAEGCNP